MSDEERPNLVVFDATKPRRPIDPSVKDYCRHLTVTIDEDAATVTCKTCGKEIDPFRYLVTLSREWNQRAYRDERAKEAYAQLEQDRRNAMARGRFFNKPATGAGRRAWAVFAEYLGREPFSIYRRGNTWYDAEDDGSHLSESYVELLLRRRQYAAPVVEQGQEAESE